MKKLESARGRFIALVFITFILNACSLPRTVNSDLDGDQHGSAPKAVSMRIVTDDLGRQITVPSKITRAVSLAPSVTESIFAAGAGDLLVGDTTYCNYPEAAKSIQKVGDTLNPNIETIVALKPDVVFVSGASQLENFTNILDQNGIAVYVMNPLDLDAVLHNIEQLGIIFGTSDKSKQVVRELADRETRIRTAVDVNRDETQADYDKRVGAIRVLVQISKEPLFTIGKGSFLNALLMSAGGRSVTDDVPSAYPKLSKETALALQPDVIILSDSADNQEPNEVFKNSPAVKNGRVLKINADIISRPGPRLVDALELLAKFLHPEKFQ